MIFQAIAGLDIYSFIPISTSSDYQLEKLKFKDYKKVFKCIKSIKENSNLKLLFRGDSQTATIYTKFIEEDLNKFFVVGQKALSHIQNSMAEIGPCSSDKSLIDEVENLSHLANKVITERSERSPQVRGKICLGNIREIGQTSDALEKIKMLLLSLLHNKGGEDSYKKFSSFISLTSRYSTAKKFACCKHTDEAYIDYKKNKKGYVFIHYIDKNSKYYTTATKLKNSLKDNFDVSWYNDKNHEYMITGALFPHNLIGFVELNDEAEKRLILNPWFFSFIKKNENCEVPEKGVNVDQKMFEQYAKDLGLEGCSIRDDKNIEYVKRFHENYVRQIHTFN